MLPPIKVRCLLGMMQSPSNASNQKPIKGVRAQRRLDRSRLPAATLETQGITPPLAHLHERVRADRPSISQ